MRKKWKAKFSTSSLLARDEYELTHPSYGKYYVLTRHGEMFPIGAFTGIRHRDVSPNVFARYRDDWWLAITIAVEEMPWTARHEPKLSNGAYDAWELSADVHDTYWVYTKKNGYFVEHARTEMNEHPAEPATISRHAEDWGQAIIKATADRYGLS